MQGSVWKEAAANPSSGVGKWFSWGPKDCKGVPSCEGTNVITDTACAQGSWMSESETKGIPSALASFGADSYFEYMVDALSNSWTKNLGIDGYTVDTDANYPCMLQTEGKGGGYYWSKIIERVRAQQPQLVHTGEGYGSWAEVIAANSNMGGQGYSGYHDAMQGAVFDGDASNLESVASTSGSDAATVLCYLNEAYDGVQPGGCPTMYFRDMTATISNIKQHLMYVALEAGSGVVSQHDYDPNSSCSGWAGCDYWSHGKPGAWWNVTNDPIDPAGGPASESPLLAFQKYRALNRLALRTKLNISGSAATAGANPLKKSSLKLLAVPKNYTLYSHQNSYEGHGGTSIGSSMNGLTVQQCADTCSTPQDPACDCVVYLAGAAASDSTCWKRSNCVPAEFENDKATIPFDVYMRTNGPSPLPPGHAGGALVYLKHDAMGPRGDAALMVFNPGSAQAITVDLSALPAALLAGKTVPFDMLSPTNQTGPPLAKAWTIQMAAGEVKAFGGFTLATFAPRKGKVASCKPDDGYMKAARGSTLQECFLECLSDDQCENVFVEHVDIVWMEKPPPLQCTLLGAVSTPSSACTPGAGTIVKTLVDGRPMA